MLQQNVTIIHALH